MPWYSKIWLKKWDTVQSPLGICDTYSGYPYLHTAVLGSDHSWNHCIHRTAHSKHGLAFCCSYDKHTSHKHTLRVHCTLLIHYHGDKDTGQPPRSTLLDCIRKMSRLSPLYTCNREQISVAWFHPEWPKIRVVIKIDAIKLLHLPACTTLQSTVAMATWRTVWGRVLLTWTLTYGAQQDLNLFAIALGLDNDTGWSLWSSHAQRCCNAYIKAHLEGRWEFHEHNYNAPLMR